MAVAQGKQTRVRGAFRVKQTDFGITPFSKAFGTIGVADTLVIYGELYVAADGGLWQVADEPANRVDEVAGRRSNGPVAGSADDGLSTRRAQLRLTETLASYASPPRGAQVLDVGCGMGGSSVFLARKYAARVTGITLSPVRVYRAFV